MRVTTEQQVPVLRGIVGWLSAASRPGIPCGQGTLRADEWLVDVVYLRILYYWAPRQTIGTDQELNNQDVGRRVGIFST